MTKPSYHNMPINLQRVFWAIIFQLLILLWAHVPVRGSHIKPWSSNQNHELIVRAANVLTSPTKVSHASKRLKVISRSKRPMRTFGISFWRFFSISSVARAASPRFRQTCESSITRTERTVSRHRNSWVQDLFHCITLDPTMRISHVTTFDARRLLYF